jgi:hypothetical protein
MDYDLSYASSFYSSINYNSCADNSILLVETHELPLVALNTILLKRSASLRSTTPIK